MTFPEKRTLAGHILARLDGSMMEIPNREVHEQLKKIKRSLERYRHKGQSDGLALPAVPK